VVAWGTRVTTVTNSGWTLVDSPLCLPTLGSRSGDDSGSTSSKGKCNGKGLK
jgi:hypothetical protein